MAAVGGTRHPAALGAAVRVRAGRADRAVADGGARPSAGTPARRTRAVGRGTDRGLRGSGMMFGMAEREHVHEHAHDDHSHDVRSHDDHAHDDHAHDERPDHDHDHGHHDHGGHDHGEHDHDHGDHGHDHGDHDHDHGAGGGLLHRLQHLVTPHSHDTADKVDSALEASRDGMRALWISLGVLGLTAALQALVAWWSGSVALLGDTLHNFADALTAVPLGIAFLIGRRPPNRRYTYGYGRAEDLAGIAIVLAIAISSALAG